DYFCSSYTGSSTWVF
nr:immunoglobulin light chain junction region [Macaca mulatta]MOV73385.1 immunoglobulin light chain junction region [Macaca mulatta]